MTSRVDFVSDDDAKTSRSGRVGRAIMCAALLALGAGITAAVALLVPAEAASASTGCTINWTGAAGDQQWTTATNWDADRVPDSADFVCISSGAGSIDYGATSSVKGLVDASSSPFEVNSGSLTITAKGSSSLVSLQTDGGSVTVDSAATLSVSSLALNSGALSNHGTFISTGPGISTGGGASFTNDGTLKITGAAFVFNGGGAFENNKGASVLADPVAGGATASFGETGGMSNSGTIEATNGDDLVISLSGGTYKLLTSTAALTASGGASIDLLNGTYAYESGSTIAGTGVHLDTNAVLEGSYSSAVLDVTGTLTQGDPGLGDGAGGFAGPGTVTITSTGSLDIPESSSFNPCSSTPTCAEAHLFNDGTINWTGGNYGLFSGGVLENAGVLNAQADNDSIDTCCGSGPGTLENDSTGVIVKSGGTNPTGLNVQVTNAGTIEALAGADLVIDPSGGTYKLLNPTAVLTASGGASIDLQNGTYVFQSGSTIAGTGVHIDTNAVLEGSSSSAVLDVTGTLTQGDPGLGDGAGGFAGPGTVTITSTGSLDIPESSSFNPCTTTSTCAKAHVLNDGTINWTGGDYGLFSGGVLENAGVLNAQADNASIDTCCGSGPGTLENDSSGVIVKSGGTKPTGLNVPVTNAGTIEALAGADLQLNGSDTEKSTAGLTATGTGSELELSSGVQTYQSGAQIDGTGVLLDGAALTGAASSSDLSVSGTLTWSSGGPAGPGTTLITKTGVVNVTGNVSMGFASAAGNLRNDGLLDFENTGGIFVLDAPSTVTNYGKILIPDNWNANSGGGCCAAGTITNELAGEIEKVGGTDLSSLNLYLDNLGTVKVTQDAQLYLDALANFDTTDATLTAGTYDAWSGGTIDLPCAPAGESVVTDDATIDIGAGGDIDGCSGSPHSMKASLTAVGGPGALALSATTSYGPLANALTNAGAVTIPATSTLSLDGAFTQTSGTTTVDGTFAVGGLGASLNGGLFTGLGTVEGAVTTSGGTLEPVASGKLTIAGSLANGGGQITVPTGTTLSVGDGLSQSAGTTQIDGGLVVTPTNISVSGGTLTGSDTVAASVTLSGGTITPEPGDTLATTGSVTNNGGQVTVPSGTTLSVGNGFSQSDGTAQVDGTFSLNSMAAVISGGTLSGSGKVNGSVTATTAATVMPGDSGTDPGVLKVSGSYSQQSGTTFDADIDGPTVGSGYGQLAVSGTATIAGSLGVSTASSFTPTPGQNYALITASSVSGTWGSVTGQFVTPGLGYRTEYDPADFSLLASLATNMSAAIAESSSPETEALVGHPVTFTVTATDNGPNAATGSEVVDTLPSGTTLVSSTPSQGTCTTSSTQVTCSLGTVAAGKAATVTIVVTPTAAGTITDAATVSSALLAYDPSSGTASSTTTVYGPSIALSPTSGTPGTQVTISGSGFVPDDTVTPAFTDADGTKTSYSGLSAQSNGSFSTTITVPTSAASGAGSVSVTGSLSGTFSAPFAVSASTSPSADLAVTNTNLYCTGALCTKYWPPGGDDTFTVTVTNKGPSTASSVELTDAVPSGVTFVSEAQTSGPTFACTTGPHGEESTECTISSLGSGAAATFTITYLLPSTTTLTSVSDTATVSSSTADPDPSNNSATSSAEVAAAAKD